MTRLRFFLVLLCLCTPGCADTTSPTFTENVIRVEKVGGDEQTDTVLAVLAEPLTVRVTIKGDPVRGADIWWEPEGRPAEIRATDANGVSSYELRLPRAAGLKMITARFEQSRASVHFAAMATPGRRVQLRKHYTEVDSLVALTGQRLGYGFGVHGADTYGNWTGDIDLIWDVTGGGALVEAGDGSVELILGPQEGENRVTARSPGLPDLEPVVFTAFGVSSLVHVVSDDWCWYQCLGDGWFEPATVRIPAGRSVGWLWAPDEYPDLWGYYPAHDIVFEDGALGAASKTGGAFSRSFPEPGTYRYRCTRHSTDFETGHVGAVIVEAM